MEKIEFKAVIGDKTLSVEVGKANGGGDSYQVLIDRFYKGEVYKALGEWQWSPSPKSWLTRIEVQMIIDMIEEGEKTL